MLNDEEAQRIKTAVEGGTRGPVLLKWIGHLLADRAERVAEEKRKAEATGRA
jgi:hypothetical protein